MSPLPAAVDRSVRDLQERAQEYLAQVTIPDPVFNLRIGWSADYDGLLRGHFAEQTPSEEILAKANATGRAILVGHGGSGKSVLLRQVMRQAVQLGIVTVFVDLKHWTAADYGEWAEECRRSFIEQIDYLLVKFGVPAVSALDLDTLPVTVRRLLIVDGLSEIRASTGNGVILAAGEFVREAICTSVVLADRMTRRDLREADRWALGRVQPVDLRQIMERLLPPDRQPVFEALPKTTQSLLQTPYFLDGFIRAGTNVGSSSEDLRTYFVTHADMNDRDLDRLAVAAFDLYGDDAARSFPLVRLEEMIGSEPVYRLLAADALRDDAGSGYFTHHLLHDYLVSRHMAQDKLRWNRTAFQRATVGASSFDSLVLALEQISDSPGADLFVRLVYDWNPYAAAYAIAEGRARGGSRVSEAMEFVMFAMLAERRFDILQATATRAGDALAVSPGAIAKSFLTASDLRLVLRLVERSCYEDSWFGPWRKLFLTTTSVDASQSPEQLLLDQDSILGWTAANVLKRLRLQASEQAAIRKCASDSNPTVRWRLVHVLGAFPTDANKATLFACLGDRDEWVRYGATRSLVEMAARADAGPRRVLLDELARVVPSGIDERSCKELQRALFVAKRALPPDWVTAISPVVQSMYDTATSTFERDQISDLALRLRKWCGLTNG